jgi:hypothetical protein
MAQAQEGKLHVTFEYSNGVEGVRDFNSIAEFHKWAFSEGDHLIDYTLHVVNPKKTLDKE